MNPLCPEIYRQRLVIEGFYTVEMTEESIKLFMVELSALLGMHIVYGPIVMQEAEKLNPKHAGFEAQLVWAESGVNLYTWKTYGFLTLDIYSCKQFDEKLTVRFVKNYFKIDTGGYVCDFPMVPM